MKNKTKRYVCVGIAHALISNASQRPKITAWGFAGPMPLSQLHRWRAPPTRSCLPHSPRSVISYDSTTLGRSREDPSVQGYREALRRVQRSGTGGSLTKVLLCFPCHLPQIELDLNHELAGKPLTFEVRFAVQDKWRWPIINELWTLTENKIARKRLCVLLTWQAISATS